MIDTSVVFAERFTPGSLFTLVGGIGDEFKVSNSLGRGRSSSGITGISP